MIKYLVKSMFFWIGAICLVVCGFLLSIVLTEISKEIKYSSDGRIIEGTILAKNIDIQYDDKNVPSQFYVMSYEFDPHTIPPQQDKSDVGETIYNTTDIGDKIEVEYLVNDPTTSRLAGTSSGWVASGIMGPFALVTGLLSLFFLASAFRRAIRQSRLWNRGIAMTARVTKFVCATPNATEDRTYHIIYEYEGPDGQTITGQSQPHSRNWFQRTAEGDVIDIVADPKNPRVSEWRKEME